MFQVSAAIALLVVLALSWRDINLRTRTHARLWTLAVVECLA